MNVRRLLQQRAPFLLLLRMTVNYKRLNSLVVLDGLPLPRVGGILNLQYKDKVFSIIDLNSPFHQIITHPETVPLTVFSTPTQLLEYLSL